MKDHLQAFVMASVDEVARGGSKMKAEKNMRMRRGAKSSRLPVLFLCLFHRNLIYRGGELYRLFGAECVKVVGQALSKYPVYRNLLFEQVMNFSEDIEVSEFVIGTLCNELM